MRVLHAYTRRYLQLNKRRTIVTIIAVILSSALICGVAMLAASFREMGIRQAVADFGNYHAVFSHVPLAKAKYIVHNHYTQTGMLSRPLGFAPVKKVRNPYKPYIFVAAYDRTSLAKQPITLLSGRLPEKEGEIIVSEQINSDGADKIRTGDTIALNLGTRVETGEVVRQIELGPRSSLSNQEKLLPGEQRTFTVTGLMKKPSFESLLAPGYTAIAYLDPAKLTGSTLVDVAILAKNPNDIYNRAPEIARAIGLGMTGGGPRSFSIDYNDNLLRWLGIGKTADLNSALWSISLIVIIIIMVGSVAVIYNAFSISVSERKRQFGLLASVGATPGQIRQAVLLEALYIALIGTVLGIAAGIAGIAATLGVANRILELVASHRGTIRLVISPAVILVTFFFTGLIILISALLPARAAARVAPIEAIRQSGELVGEQGRRLRTGWLTRRFFGLEGELALKNLRRYRRKYRTTIFSLFISVVMFITFSSFMFYSIRSTAHASLDYDYYVYLRRPDQINYSPFIQQALALPSVKEAMVYRELHAVDHTSGDQLDNRLLRDKNFQGLLWFDEEKNSGRYGLPVSIRALGEGEFRRYLAARGLEADDYTNIRAPKGILINKISTIVHQPKTSREEERQYRALRIKPGDKIILSENKTSPDSDPTRVALTVGALEDRDQYRILRTSLPVLIVSDQVFDSIVAQYKQKDYSGTLFIKSNNNQELDRQIKNLYAATVGGPLQYNNLVESEKKDQMSVVLINLFCYGFITLITLIGISNIVNTIDTNVRLRRREFAMLKSVGMTPGGFAKMLRYESFFYGFKALLYGLPVGIGLSYLIYRQFDRGITPLAFTLPWAAVAGCVAAVFAIVCGTMLYSGSKIKDDHIVDAIKEENL